MAALENRMRHLEPDPANSSWGRRVLDGGGYHPLPELCRLASAHNALVMVDDAHAIGVLGNRGAAPLALRPDRASALIMGHVQQIAGQLGRVYCNRMRPPLIISSNHSRALIFSRQA